MLCWWLAAWLVWSAGQVAAWNQEDLEAVERLLERQLEPKREVAAKAKAEAEAKARAESKARQDALASISKDMAQIPAGTFLMGCSPGDSE